jgi:hypothetical protein
MQEQSAGGHGLDTWKATAPTEHGTTTTHEFLDGLVSPETRLTSNMQVSQGIRNSIVLLTYLVEVAQEIYTELLGCKSLGDS